MPATDTKMSKFTFQKFQGKWYLLPLDKFKAFYKERKKINRMFPNRGGELADRFLETYREHVILSPEDYIFEMPEDWTELAEKE